ncbi:hypothetical protein [Ravibacter arvi]
MNSLSKKVFFPVFFFALICQSLTASGQKALTNEDIISMTGAKIAKSIIIDRIKAGTNNFRLGADDMVALKQAKVIDAVFEEMFLVTENMPTLQNDDIIALHQGKLSQNIIIKRIQHSDTRFNTEPDALIALKMAKVPDKIVEVMMKPTRAAKVGKGSTNLIAGDLPPHPQNLPAPARSRFSEPGVYYEEYNPGGNYTQLEPTTTNQTRRGTVGESVANQYTAGMVGTSERVGLANPSANMVIKDNRPVFYFVFSGANRKDQNTVAENIFSGVASPNDFVLIRARVSNRGREITVGRSSSYSSETGFGPGAVPFRFRKISNQLYKVYFDDDVAAGEYAFFYNKGSEFSSSLKLYDFSLQNNTKPEK